MQKSLQRKNTKKKRRRGRQEKWTRAENKGKMVTTLLSRKTDFLSVRVLLHKVVIFERKKTRNTLELTVTL